MQRVSKTELLQVLEPFDSQLKKKIVLIAVGGTAMTLLDIKASTKDVDFNIPKHTDYKEFASLYKKISPGVKIDFWESNMVFSEVLPNDYLEKTKRYKGDFNNIDVRILHPLDIICSKISRSNEADMEDISECIKKFKITKKQLMARAKQYGSVGNEDVFHVNLRLIIENFF